MPAIPPLRPTPPRTPSPGLPPEPTPVRSPVDLKGKAKAAPVPAEASDLTAGATFADAPKTVNGKPIEVKWNTGRIFSYKADEFPDGHTLGDHPKGVKPYHGEERRPKRMERVAREGNGEHADPAGERVLRRKLELKHYLAEFGPGVVQRELSFLPALVRPPSAGELYVMQDFAQSVHQYTRMSQGKKGPKTGEFIATYRNVTDPASGAKSIERTNFRYNPGHSIDVPLDGAPHDYVIHSHPYDPKAPLAAGLSDPLGGAYPSGQDRLMARTIGKSGLPPPTELMMHGGQIFHTHAHDLHFSLLDPAAGEVIHLADRSKGPGWDDALYVGPANRPPKPGSAEVTGARGRGAMAPESIASPRSGSPEPGPSAPAPGSAAFKPKTPGTADDDASIRGIYGGD